MNGERTSNKSKSYSFLFRFKSIPNQLLNNLQVNSYFIADSNGNRVVSPDKSPAFLSFLLLLLLLAQLLSDQLRLTPSPLQLPSPVPCAQSLPSMEIPCTLPFPWPRSSSAVYNHSLSEMTA